MEFKIESPGGSQIEIVQEIPKNLRKFRLPAGKTHYLKAGFGDMLFHHFAGDGFSIWYSNYFIRHNAKVVGMVDTPLIEWHIPIRNNFPSLYDGTILNNLKVKQLGASYTPYLHNTVEFIKDMQYDTFDIHFYKTFLQEYAKHCPALDRFLLKVEKEQAAELLSATQYLDEEMIQLINSILQYDCRDVYANRFYESVVNQLLIRFIHRLDKLEGINTRRYSFSDIRMAEQAKEIIDKEVHKAYSIAELARELRTNPYKLQTTFKFVFNCTVYDCSKAARMNHAKRLLLDTNLSQQEIGMLIGYPDQPNFAKAFKDYFGITPGEFRSVKNGKDTFNI